MKKATYLLLLFGLINCQRDKDIIPEALQPEAIQMLEGQWEQTSHQTTVNDKKVWVADSTSGSPDLIFRADGVPLYGDGGGMCCSPKNYLLNGKLYAIAPKSPVKLSSTCINALCMYCETIEIHATESTLLWISCGFYQATYRKLP